jgi:ketosteroid isomerase-like protein
MKRTSDSRIALLLIALAIPLASGQAPDRPATNRPSGKSEDFAAAIKRIRQTWVQEFNAGHADKVAGLYADEAVLMRRSGSVHNRDSIQADLQRSITAAQARNYFVQSLHSEGSGNIGYDTGMYNEDVRSHVAEGNYLIVLQRINGEWKIVAHALIPNPRQN